jgi:hypothetical protein
MWVGSFHSIYYKVCRFRTASTSKGRVSQTTLSLTVVQPVWDQNCTLANFVIDGEFDDADGPLSVIG